MFGQGLTIPKGKKVQFFNNREIETIQGSGFLLEQDVNIKLSSQFSAPIDAEVNAGAVALAGLSRTAFGFNIPVAFKQLGFQQWAGTDPLKVNFTVGLYTKTNALNDVVIPSRALAKLPVPYLIGNNGGLAAPGPSLASVLLKGNNFSGIDIQLGPCLIRNCIITGVDLNYSIETDELDYPISCVLNIEASTAFTANSSMINDLFPRVPVRNIDENESRFSRRG